MAENKNLALVMVGWLNHPDQMQLVFYGMHSKCKIKSSTLCIVGPNALVRLGKSFFRSVLGCLSKNANLLTRRIMPLTHQVFLPY